MNKLMMGKIPFVFRFWWLWELIAFLVVGYFIGYLYAFLLLLLGCVLGFLLIRGQGMAAMKQVKTEPMTGSIMMMQRIESSFIMLSGLLLLIPGFLTDIIALICLIPAVRRKLIRKIIGFNMTDLGKMAGQFGQAANQAQNKPAKKDNTIEGEFWREDKKDD